MINKTFLILLALTVAGLIVLSVANKARHTPETVYDNRLNIVTTLFPTYDFAKHIGGNKVNISLLLPPGMEAHNFEPKPSDIVEINNADVFVYTNKQMETWVEDIVRGVTGAGVLIVDASDGIELIESFESDHHDGPEHEAEDEHAHTGTDPHVWLDFVNAQAMVDNIAEAMAKKDPDNRVYYFNNANSYKKELVELDNLYQTTLSQCSSRAVVYGGHHAFGYMMKRYNLLYTAAQGFSPDSEPTANDLISLVNQIKRNNLKHIFYEELSSPKIAETISRETSVQMLLLNGAHNVSKEDMSSGVSFVSMMNNNLKNLSQGLGCVSIGI